MPSCSMIVERSTSLPPSASPEALRSAFDTSQGKLQREISSPQRDRPKSSSWLPRHAAATPQRLSSGGICEPCVVTDINDGAKQSPEKSTSGGSEARPHCWSASTNRGAIAAS